MVKSFHIILWIMIILIIVAGILFVFGDKVLEEVNNNKLLDGSPNLENIREVEEMKEVGGIGGMEDSLGGDNFGEVVDISNCRMQQIQYSLRNFEKSIECTEIGVKGCVRIVIHCSMEVYSFDRDVSGKFGIRYTLVDAENNELDFELVEKEVGFGNSVIFSTEFVRSDMFGVDDNLTCPFTVESVPRKEVCN
ncbi:MAG: hypothetical protein ABIH79_01540 [archaeon]